MELGAGLPTANSGNGAVILLEVEVIQKVGSEQLGEIWETRYTAFYSLVITHKGLCSQL